MLLFIVILAIAAVVAYFVLNGKKKSVQHVEDIKVQSTVLPVAEPVEVVEPIAEVQVAEPEQLEERKKAVVKKKAVKKAK